MPCRHSAWFVYNGVFDNIDHNTSSATPQHPSMAHVCLQFKTDFNLIRQQLLAKILACSVLALKVELLMNFQSLIHM